MHFYFVHVKFGPMRHLYFFIFYCLIFTGTTFAAIPKAEVISDGDRGLALEFLATAEDCWYKTLCVDSASNIYVGGRFKKTFALKDTVIKCNSSGKNACIAKCDAKGNTLWAKQISTDGAAETKKFFVGDTTTLFAWISCWAEDEVEDNTYYYDNVVISPDAHDKHKYQNEFLLKIDANDGTLLDFTELDNVYYASMVQSADGSFIYMGNVGVGAPITYMMPFEGLNADRLKTDSVTTNLADFYVAKISQDFTLDWDFIIRSHNDNDDKEYEESDNLILGATSGDTLYIMGILTSDSLNFSLDASQPDIVKGIKQYSNNDMFTCFVASYDISGNYPKLIKCTDRPFNKFIFSEQLYSSKKHGAYAALNNPDYSTKEEVADQFIYASLDTSLSFTTNGRASYGTYICLYADVFHYDKADNFILPNYRYYLNEQPLVIDFSEKTPIREFSSKKYPVGSLSKFSPDGTYDWSLVVLNAHLYTYEIHPNDGSLFIAGVAFTIGDDADMDPASNKSAIISPDDGGYLAKYHETYRLSAQTDLEHALISVPDTFVWHGYTAEVRVTTDADYHVVKVYTGSGKELEHTSGNTYILKGISQPETIYAEVAPGAGVANTGNNTFLISPNPVTDEIVLPAHLQGGAYQVYAADSKLVKRGTASSTIQVTDLRPGVYELLVTTGRDTAKTKFVKK